MYKVYLSPSNQMHNRCQYGDVEGKHCPQLAAMIAERLTAKGYECKTRTPSNSLTANMAEAKKWGADLYVPLHTNAAGSGARGTRFGYYGPRADSKAACEVFKAVWSRFYPLPDKVKTCEYNNFGEAKRPHCPSVYAELIFHSNAEDAAFLHEHMAECADALVACVEAYFAAKLGGTLPTVLVTLKRGSKGEAVKELQAALNMAGAVLVVDGSFGPLTEEALMKYQASKKIEADGICGPVTWGKIKQGG